MAFLYKFLDIFFLAFHTVLTLFNLLGWIFRPLRRLNLATLVLTGLSWFVLGIFYGIGYCPLTDWHWKVLHHLGKADLPDSYIQYLIYRLTGLRCDPALVEWGTTVGFFLAIGMSVYLNIRSWRTGKIAPGKVM